MRTPTPHYLYCLYCFHARTPRLKKKSDSSQHWRHTASTEPLNFHVPSCMSFTPCSRSAEQVVRCFSVEYSFHLIRALLHLVALKSKKTKVLNQMLNIAQIPQLVSASTDHAFVLFIYLFIFLFIYLFVYCHWRLHCLFLVPVYAALFALLSSCYLLLFIVASCLQRRKWLSLCEGV